MQCKTVMDTLMSSATETLASHISPIFHSIVQTGVKEFRSTTKTVHRKGMNRKRMGGLSVESDNKRRKGQGVNPLIDIMKKGPSRPWQKRMRRKPFKFQRQVNNQVKTRMLKTVSLVQKGMLILCKKASILYTIHVNCAITYTAKQTTANPNLRRVSARELLEVTQHLVTYSISLKYNVILLTGNNH